METLYGGIIHSAIIYIYGGHVICILRVVVYVNEGGQL